MQWIIKWLGYRLDESTPKKHDDRAFHLLSNIVKITSEVTSLYKVTNLSAYQMGDDFGTDLMIEKPDVELLLDIYW